jgi:cyclic pyranopterin phosphate synthase
MPDEDQPFTIASKLMQADEIETIAAAFIKLGVNKIRLTGGEPLVRKDAGDIIDRLSKYGVELTLTTNGVRIHDFIDNFKRANIRSVNVSLDTLLEDKFQLITRRNAFKQVVDNIHLLIENGIHVKLNTVAMKGINDNEIGDFIKLTKDLPLHVRFIEFMPFTGNQWDGDKVLGWKEILQIAEDTGLSFIKLRDEVNDTSRKYKVLNFQGTFAVISTMTAPFCSTCNRMRLTADGKMKNCLFSKDEVDILGALRKGEDFVPLIRQSIQDKAAERGGQFTDDYTKLDAKTIENRSMIAIGG